MTACSDPGIVFNETIDVAVQNKDFDAMELGALVSRADSDPANSAVVADPVSVSIANVQARSRNSAAAALAASQNKIECGQCNILRPRNASHCYECGVCIVELDHHCPVSCDTLVSGSRASQYCLIVDG